MRTPRLFLPHLLAALLLLGFASGCSAEARKARLSSRADRYFKAGEYAKAKIEYLNVLRRDPQNVLAYERLGIMWADEGAPLRGGAFLLRARQLAPGNLANRLRLARVYAAVGQFGEARKEAAAVLQQEPTNDEALLILAETARNLDEVSETALLLQKQPPRDSVTFLLASANVEMKRQNFTTAESLLKRALALDPKSAPAHVGMATLYLFRRNLERAGQELQLAADASPSRSLERYKFAEFKAQTGATGEAVTLLKAIIEKTPDYLPAWRLLAQLAFKQKQYDETQKYLASLLTQDPDDVDGRLLQAETFLAKNDSRQAVEALERLDKAYPNVPIIKFRLGRAHMQNNNPPLAQATLEQAITLKPDYAEAILLLGDLNLRLGEAQPVVNAMQELLKKQPTQLAAGLLLAQAFQALGRLDDAAGVLREVGKAAPRDPQPPLLLGLLLRQQGKAQEARAALENAQELAPADLTITYQLVELDLADKDFVKAQERVRRQLEKAPDSPAALFLQGRVYSAQGDWAQSEKVLRRAVELDANFVSAYELLVSNYLATNRLPEAISQTQALLARNPDNAGALMMSGLIYEKLNDFAKAAAAYEKLLTANPNVPAALNNLAFLYAEHLNQLDKAYDLARKVRTLQPDDPSVADTLGWVLFKRGDFQQAQTLFQESAAKLADNPMVQFHLGMADYMMGQTEAARAAFRRAVESPADFSDKAETQRRLALLGDSAGGAGEPSVADMEASLAKQPNDLIARMRLGEAYEKQSQPAKAAATYEQALTVNPKLLEAATRLAQLYAGPLQQKEKAFEYAKKARALAPTDPHVAALVGRIAYQNASFAQAYNLLQDASGQLAGEPEILRDFAWAAYSLGNVDEAQRAMQQVQKIAPGGSPLVEEAKTFLALTAVDQTTPDLAARQPEIDRLLQQDVGYVPALMARAALQTQRKERPAATASYESVLRRYPDFAPAQKRLAALYADDPQNRTKAYDLAMRARKVFPDDPELAQTLAAACYYKKDYAYAIRLLEDSRQQRPLDAKSLFYLGMSYAQTKQTELGREALQGALAAGLDDSAATEAKRVLAQPAK